MEESNFYYGDVYNIADNDVSEITKGNVFWMEDNSNANYHPYVIANAYMHDKYPVVYAFVINSKPYYSNMVPITMKGSISYINPFRIKTFNFGDFDKKRFYGTLVNTQALDIAYKIHSLMFYVNGFDEKSILDEYKSYLKRFFIKNKCIPEYKRRTGSFKMYETNLKFTTTLVDFNIESVEESDDKVNEIEDGIGLNEIEETLEQEEVNVSATNKLCVSREQVIIYSEQLVEKETSASDFVIRNMSDEEVKLFLALFTIYTSAKVGEICNISQPTVWRRKKDAIERLGGSVVVI